jgi:hypothetical protein
MVSDTPTASSNRSAAEINARAAQINAWIMLVLLCAIIGFCWALLYYVYDYTPAGYGSVAGTLILGCIVALFIRFLFRKSNLSSNVSRFSGAIFLSIILIILVLPPRSEELLIGVDMKAAFPILKSAQNVEQLKLAIDASPNNRVLQIVYEVRSLQESTRHEITALIGKVIPPVLLSGNAPLSTMNREQLQSHASVLTNAKEAAMSADKDLDSILKTLRTKIVSSCSKLGSSSIANAFTSNLLVSNDKLAADNVKIFGQLFSAAAQLYSVRADITDFLLAHGYKFQDNKISFDDESLNTKYASFSPLEDTSIEALKKAMTNINDDNYAYAKIE